MVVIDKDRCAGCGVCMAFCPKEAIEVWGYAKIDTEKCDDCRGGVYHFEQNVPLTNKELILDRTKTPWKRLCIEYCTTDALNAAAE